MTASNPIKWRGCESRPIPGANGYFACEDGTILSSRVATRVKALKPYPRKEDGRKRYTIRLNNGSYRRSYGSALVLEAFVGPRPIGMEACHNNGVCLDDSAVNLRWDTPVANKADMKRHGTRACGETHPKAKLRDDQIPKVIAMRADGYLYREIGRHFGVSEQRVCQICKKGSR